MTRRALLAPLVALTLLAPTATAVWYASGTYEPDTAYDVSAMWLDPDRSPDPLHRQVYFNVVPASTLVMANPNSGTLGTRFALAPSQVYEAYLGVWKDCNGDGYVGLAEGAVREYRAELADGRICPPMPGETRPHNDGEWVYEYMPIGMVEPCEYLDRENRTLCGNAQPFSPNPMVFYSNATFIWGDVGAPDERVRAPCNPTSFPRGTFSGTGALARHLDCATAGRVVGAWNGATAGTGLEFDDPENPQRDDSPANVVFPVNLWGNPHQGRTGLLEQGSDDPAFETWDCREPKGGQDVRDPHGRRVVNVEDPTSDRSLTGRKEIPGVGSATIFDDDYDGDGAGEYQVNLTDEDGSYVWLPAPTPQVRNPTGSYWDAAEAAQDGVQYQAEGFVLARPADCDASTNNTAHLLYSSPESRAAPPATPAKTRNDHVFTFFDGTRGHPTASADGALPAPLHDLPEASLGRRTPLDAGVPYARELTALGIRFVGGTWRSASTPSDPVLVDRTTLEPEDARYASFYAMVGPTEIAGWGFLLPGSTGTYGVEACGSLIGPGQPERNGWACDPEAWFKDAEGKDTRPYYRTPEGRSDEAVPLGYPVGTQYQLRDVDCLDGEVARGSGAHASLAPITEGGVCRT